MIYISNFLSYISQNQALKQIAKVCSVAPTADTTP